MGRDRCFAVMSSSSPTCCVVTESVTPLDSDFHVYWVCFPIPTAVRSRQSKSVTDLTHAGAFDGPRFAVTIVQNPSAANSVRFLGSWQGLSRRSVLCTYLARTCSAWIEFCFRIEVIFLFAWLCVSMFDYAALRVYFGYARIQVIASGIRSGFCELTPCLL